MGAEDRRNVAQCVELNRKGFSAPTIAATVGLRRPAVETMLAMAREVEESAAAGEAGEGGGGIAIGRLYRDHPRRGPL